MSKRDRIDNYLMLLNIANNPHTKQPNKLFAKLQQERNRKVMYNEDKQEITKLRNALMTSKRMKLYD